MNRDGQRLALPSGSVVKRAESSGLTPEVWSRVAAPGIASEAADQFTYATVLWRHKGTLVLYALLCAAAAGFLSRLQPPTYKAAAALEIVGLSEHPLGPAELEPSAGASGGPSDAYVQTQADVLGSRALIARVATRLRMDQRPEFSGSPESQPRWRRLLKKDSEVPSNPRELAVASAVRGLRVSVGRGTRVVKMDYTATDPKLAADFLNTLAHEFIDHRMEIRLSSAHRMGEWFSRQLEAMKERLRRSEDALQAYTKATGLIITGNQENVAEVKLRRLQEELSRAQADRMVKQAQYELVKRSPADALPQVLDSQSLRDYQQKLTDLRRQLAESSALLTANHPKVKQLTAQIDALRTAAETERVNIIRRIANEFETAGRNEQLLAAAYAKQEALVSGQDAKEMRYQLLKREVDTNREIYDTLLRKVREASLSATLRASNVLMVDPAEPPLQPFAPRPLRNSFLGLVSGLFFGVLFVCLRSHADRSLKRPGDASQHLNLPELGVIPAESALPVPRLSARALSFWRTANPDLSRIELASLVQNSNLIAESFRDVLASILFCQQNGFDGRLITFTSPEPGVGKTTTVSNLGIALARIRRPVLLVDGDLRRGRLHEVFSLPNRRGLSEILASGRIYDGQEPVVQETKVPGLYLLTRGARSESAADYLQSPALKELLDLFRSEYENVLVDSPPVLQIVDARILGRLSDAVVLVCQAGVTDRDSAAAAVQRLVQDGSRLMGTILNHWNPEIDRSYYRYRHHYHQ